MDKKRCKMGPELLLADDRVKHFREREADIEGQSRLDFTELIIRQGFIKKVYSILMVQLLITAGFIALFVLSEDVRLWVQKSSPLLIGACILSFIIVIIISRSDRAKRRFPINFCLLFAFTIVEGFLVGVISSFYDAKSVLLAAAITTVICLALTIFAFQTKYDFTGMGPYLFSALIVVFLFGIASVFLQKYFPVVEIVYSSVGALLFSMYLIYDTQLIIEGTHKNKISAEEYTFAALTIYLDIINIFIKILKLVGKKRQ